MGILEIKGLKRCRFGLILIRMKVWEDMLRERWISWGWFHHFILRKNMIDGHCWRFSVSGFLFSFILISSMSIQWFRVCWFYWRIVLWLFYEFGALSSYTSHLCYGTIAGALEYIAYMIKNFRNWQESGIPVTEGYGFSLVSSNQLKTLFQYNQLDGKAFLLVIHFDGLGTRGKVWLRVQVHDLPNTSRLVYDGLFVEKGSNF